MTRRRKYRPSSRLVLLTLVLAAFGAGRARADHAPSPRPGSAAGAPAAALPSASSTSAAAAAPAPSSPPDSGPAEGTAPAPAAALDSTTPAAPGKESSPAAPGKESSPAAPGKESSPAAPGKESSPAAPGKESSPAAPAKDALPAAPGEKGEAAAGPDPGSAPPSPQSANATLKALTEAGVRLYERGDFAGAIQSFSAGYALRPKPLFLFNIAQAHRKAGQDQSALTFYAKFIAASPQSPYRAEAEAYIAYLRGKLGLDKPPPRPPRVYKKGWFWAVLSTAAVTAGVAVTLGIVLGTRDPPTTLGTVEPRFR